MEKRDAGNATGALIEAGGAATGAGIGLLLGGPVGALVGAGAGPLVASAAKYAVQLATLFQNSLEGALAENGSTEGDLVATVESDPEKRSALMRLLSAVSQSADPIQLQILARAVASLADADARQTMALQELGAIIIRATPLHLAVLKFIAEEEHQAAIGVDPAALLTRFSAEKQLVRSAVRSLELDGLIVDEARLEETRKGVFWKTTDFGRWLLGLHLSRQLGDPIQKLVT